MFDLTHILSLYRDSGQLLNSGRFGRGLWPVEPEFGQLMAYLIRLFELKRGIEIGAGVGFSTAWLASAFAENGGELLTFEYFPPKIAQLERNMASLFGKYDRFLQLYPTDIGRAIDKLGSRKFDFVFLDQRKSDYLPHLQLLLPKLKRGAFICADNVSSHVGACQPYLQFVRRNKQFESFYLDQGAGLEISRLKPIS